MTITFSTDKGYLSLEDNIKTGELAESFFKMEENPDQIPATIENCEWINANIPECDNVIKDDGEIIGYTLIMPCTKDLMEKFLAKEITENEMFEKIKLHVDYNNFDTIYICAMTINPDYRGRGLASEGLIKSIKKIVGARKIKPILFYWKQTEEGQKVCKKVADLLKFELKEL
jgi:ribosomal protein S18 acetylase RimI-like enzyme